MTKSSQKIDVDVLECSLAKTFKLRRSRLKMENLFNKVRNTDQGTKRKIVQFINLGEFKPRFLPIAAELAYFSATQRHRKTLLLDTSRNSSLIQSMTTGVANIGGVNDDFQVFSVKGTELYLMGMPKPKDGRMIEKEDIQLLFDSVGKQFDFAVVHSDSPLSSPETANFSELSEGCVLILQAEKTRIPVMKHIIEQLEFSGAKIIGTVVDGRRFYIPKFIYNILFKS